MPSDNYQEAYVWVWLPGETGPVVAGRLDPHGDQLAFMYGQSYLARDNAISLYEPELPLQSGEIPLRDYMDMPSCIRDASPDAWGVVSFCTVKPVSVVMMPKQHTWTS